LSAVGRPSNMGGVEHLAGLLKDVPPEKDIIVTGEYDPNEKGQWPGRDGAVKTAEALAARLGRPTYWALPPRGSKDVRQWVQDQQAAPACADQWQEMGEALSAGLVERRQRVEPSERAEPVGGVGVEKGGRPCGRPPDGRDAFHPHPPRPV